MKTYFLKENYNDTIRITVEDDVTVNVSAYESDREGYLVKFAKPTVGYGENLIASFGNVHVLYLEGTNIEEQKREYAKSEDSEQADFTTEWTSISTTS